MIGHIAYSLYKLHKVQYIEQFKADNNKTPKESDLKPFHDVSCLDSSIERYREQATIILQEWAGATLDQQAEAMEKDYESHLQKIIKPLKTKWWVALLQSFLGAFFFSLFLAAVAFIYTQNGTDLPFPTTQQEQVCSQDSLK